MKFKYRWLLIRFVALIMFVYITCLALSLPVAAIVDTSRGEGNDYNVTGASPFPMTVGFAFRSSDNSDYNYITATDVGGYGQEYNRTLTGTDEFTYTFDELNENSTTTRYMHYSFGNIYWSSQSLFGYRYGFQPLTLSVDTLGTDEACETIVLRAPEVVFNTYAFDFFESFYNGIDEDYDIADLAYLGIPVISAPQVFGPSQSKYVGTCSIIYSVTDQHGNVKDFNYAIPYDSTVDGYIPLLYVEDLYTYYSSIDPAQNSSKILISDWYVFWDVDYYEFVDTTQPSDIDVKVYSANDTLVHSDGFTITDDIGLTFSQWASHFSESGYSVEVKDNGVELIYTSGSDTYSGYIYNGIDKVYGSTVIQEGTTYGATLNYEEPVSASFSIYHGSSFVGSFDFVEGMTWQEFVNSSSNPDYEYLPSYKRFYLSTNSASALVYFNNEGAGALVRYSSSGYQVTSGDLIENGHSYNTSSYGGGANDPGMEGPSASYGFDWGASLDEGPSASAVGDTPAAASVEWLKVDSDKRNIVQIGYPLYDTSNGDPDYAAILNYPNFTNYLQGSDIDIPTGPGIPGDSDSDPSSFTRWLGVAISGFTDVELWPGFSIGGLLAILVSFAVVMMFLKVFAGG